LNRAFTWATTAVSVAALPGGAFVDACGPMLGVTVAGALNVSGLIGIALCKEYGSVKFDLFLVSFVIVAIGGSLTMFCGYSLPFLFPRRATLLMVLYDSGTRFEALWWMYAGVCAVNFLLLIVAWSLNRQQLLMSRAGGGDQDGGNHSQGGGLQAKPFGQQLRSLEFLLILLVAAIQVPRSNFYLGVEDLVNAQIAAKLDTPESTRSTLKTIVGLIIPQGWLAVPLIQASIRRLGIFGTLHITTMFGVLCPVVQLIPNLWLQLVGAIAYTVFRTFLFSIIAAYNAELFGPQTMGRVMGVCLLVAGMVNLSQTPLVKMSYGNFALVNLGSILVSLLIVPFVLFVQLRRWRLHLKELEAAVRSEIC